MRLTFAEVSNYKSFRGPQRFELQQGFNVVVGQNNSGKTALLEALALQWQQRPHRSLQTVPDPYRFVPDPSRLDMGMSIQTSELLEIVQAADLLRIAVPRQGDFGYTDQSGPQIDAFRQRLLSQPNYEFQISCTPNEITGMRFPAHGLYAPADDSSVTPRMFVFNVRKKDGYMSYVGVQNFARQDEFSQSVVVPQLRERLYFFRAERRVSATAPMDTTDALVSDSSNLASVLNLLQSNRAKFDNYVGLVKEVLPNIRGVSVRPLSRDAVEVLVWFDDPAKGRADLAISLAEVGTGTGQVLAILYVVANARHPQVIIIDEPQTFLHPGALRNLIDICNRFPQHQYVVATHSPAVVSQADPATIHHLRLSDRETVVSTLRRSDTDQLRSLLADVGATLSDVFGADRVLWVEGMTEEVCFPRVLNHFRSVAAGTAIVGVKTTGDFRRKDARLAFEIYQRLSSTVLLPPAVSFLFDRDDLTPKDMQDLEKRSSEKVKFLPQTMYESYLLHPSALSKAMNSMPGFSDTAISEKQVRDWINAHRPTFAMKVEGASDRFNDARLLQSLFAELSQTRVAYEKVRDGASITRLILQHDPEHLRGLVDFLRSLF